MLNRRHFIKLGGAAIAGVGLSQIPGCSAKPPLFKISLAEWSLHKTLFTRKLDNLQFPVVAKKDYGIDAIEYVNQFFMHKAKDMAYLKELKSICDNEGVKSQLIMCDNEGALGEPDEAKRIKAVENHYKWVEAATFLGCHSIRVNARSAGEYDEQLKLAADGLARLTEFGARHEINVIVENHGGLSSNGAWLSAVIKTVNHPRCGTLPDFGNFKISQDEEYDRYKGVTEMMPFAKGVSAKSMEFDADGNETQTDYFKMMKIVLDAGYHDHVGIEYSGSIPEPEGIMATKKLLERVRAELS